jgi:hypothetical protein
MCTVGQIRDGVKNKYQRGMVPLFGEQTHPTSVRLEHGSHFTP